MKARTATTRIHRLILLTCACMFASACVSDTLSVQNTQAQPQPVALQTNQTGSYDPAQRAQAIEEIRAKAEQPGSGQLTNAYVEGVGATEQLTPEQREKMAEELGNSAEQNAQSVTDAELTAKQDSIRRLQAKGASHYKNAVNSIEN